MNRYLKLVEKRRLSTGHLRKPTPVEAANELNAAMSDATEALVQEVNRFANAINRAAKVAKKPS